tara:strand:+ start:145 stop:495 length:351 start_codon:yes stop_codon:yes gene_type:complete
MNNIHTQELDENTLLINSTDNLDYIKLLEKYDLLKLNEKKLIENNKNFKTRIDNLRKINYNSHIKNDKLNKELNNISLENKNLELDIKQMDKELNEYKNIIDQYQNIIENFNNLIK